MMTQPSAVPVSAAELPAISPVLGRLSELTTVDEQSFERIVQIITTDPALTARVLAVANSSFFGLTYRVTTVQEAAIVIGTHGLSQIALGLVLGGAFRSLGSESTAHARCLWRHSVAVAVAAESIARRCGYPTPNEAFVVGLMHDIGKLIWMHTIPESYADLLDARDARSLECRERQALGSDHAQLGRLACQEWDVPDTIGRAIASHHASGDPDRDGVVVSAVKVANQIAKLSGLDAGHNAVADASVLQLLEHRGIGESALFEVMAGLTQHVDDVERLFTSVSEIGRDDRPKSSNRGFVEVDMKSPSHEKLIALLVRKLGYETATALAGESEPEAVISDRRGEDDSRILLPPQSLLTDMVSIDELRNWLSDCLSDNCERRNT